LLFLVSGFGAVSEAAAFVTIGVLAFLAFSLWIVLISIEIWRRVPRQQVA
jgi:hypothetical protein